MGQQPRLAAQGVEGEITGYRQLPQEKGQVPVPVQRDLPPKRVGQPGQCAIGQRDKGVGERRGGDCHT
ncbi:hypothetical protein GCM10027214_06610 [Stenotrophomonas tumulicola]